MSPPNLIKDLNIRPETVKKAIMRKHKEIFPNMDVDNNFGYSHQNKSRNRQMGLYQIKKLHGKGMMNKSDKT